MAVTSLVESRSPLYDSSEDPRFRLLIGGEDWTEDSAEIAFAYTDESGGSELTFATDEPIADLVGQRVTLRLGYGETAPYFSGKLARSRPSPFGRFPTAKALGPFAELGTQHFGEETTYQGINIGPALYDIHNRADFPSGTIEVVKPNSFYIEERVFAEENTLLEGSKSLMESADFVGSDMPGAHGRRLLMPRPDPGEQGKAVRRFTPEDYPYDGLEIEPQEEVAYSKVVVFRREEAGGYSIYATAPVRSERAPRNRILYITEFVGSQSEAQETARKRARLVEAGVSWKLSGVRLDPSLEKYQQVEAVRDVERREGRFRETYSLRIDDGLSGTPKDWTMDLSGSGLLSAERKIGSARIELPHDGSGVIPYSESVPFGYTAQGEPYVDEEAQWARLENGQLVLDTYAAANDYISIVYDPTRNALVIGDDITKPPDRPSNVRASDTRTLGELGEYTIGELN